MKICLLSLAEMLNQCRNRKHFIQTSNTERCTILLCICMIRMNTKKKHNKFNGRKWMYHQIDNPMLLLFNRSFRVTIYIGFIWCVWLFTDIFRIFVRFVRMRFALLLFSWRYSFIKKEHSHRRSSIIGLHCYSCIIIVSLQH